MPRTRILALVVSSALALVPAVADAHQGDPNYRSTVTAIEPAMPGVRMSVINYDDSLEVVNRSPETLVMEGYSGEPYVRIQPDGTVEVNRNSPAAYLNDERDGSGTVPPNATKDAAPAWKLVDRTGRYAFHDHRIHYMGEGRPPAVKDPDVRTKAYDWEVPFRIGGAAAVVEGELLWVPTPEDGAPATAVAGLALIAVVGLGTVVVVRRRRRSAPDGAAEAW